MTRNVVTVTNATTYSEMVQLVETHNIGALPVMGNDQRVIGIVTDGDLLQKEERPAEPGRWRLTRRAQAQARKARALTAADVMSSPAIVAATDVPIAQAARSLHRHGIKHLPVVDRDGRLAGIVSRLDLLKVFARPDEDVRSDITEGVIRNWLWLEPTVDVEVRDGIVSLTGSVERRSDVELVASLSSGVDGVVAINNQLTYRFDDSQVPRAVEQHIS